jgi:hypothetical protein
MTPIPKATLDASLAAYQRDLARALLPTVTLFGVALVGLLLTLISVEGKPPYPTWIVISAFVIVFGLAQIPLAIFRRNVRRLSAKHGLICPSCSAPLGFGYATLKRTGNCRACGANVTTSA